MHKEFFCFPSNLRLIFYANYSLLLSFSFFPSYFFPYFFLLPLHLFFPFSLTSSFSFLLVHIRFSTHFFYLLICKKTQTDFQSILPFLSFPFLPFPPFIRTLSSFAYRHETEDDSHFFHEYFLRILQSHSLEKNSHSFDYNSNQLKTN